MLDWKIDPLSIAFNTNTLLGISHELNTHPDRLTLLASGAPLGADKGASVIGTMPPPPGLITGGSVDLVVAGRAFSGFSAV